MLVCGFIRLTVVGVIPHLYALIRTGTRASANSFRPANHVVLSHVTLPDPTRPEPGLTRYSVISQAAGSVIGKGGSNINRLREQVRFATYSVRLWGPHTWFIALCS